MNGYLNIALFKKSIGSSRKVFKSLGDNLYVSKNVEM
jgi:hypothetical protein